MASSKLLVGIDLGTTNSVVAYVQDIGGVECVVNSEGARATPSVVQVQADGNHLVGAHARGEAVIESERTAAFFKRDMGTDAEYEFARVRLSPVDLSAALLTKLKSDTESYLNRSIDGAVVTVPAYFRDTQRVATVEACRQAGVTVLQTINEPTAAAITYGKRHDLSDERILVYDLGGGTFDVSLVHVTDESIEVLMTDGNHRLGGKDWDDEILAYLCHEFEREHGMDPQDDLQVLQDLSLRAEETKKALSYRTSITVPIAYQGLMSRIEISREQFASLTQHLLGQTETIILRLLESANRSPAELNRVLLVGASTRMPMCAELIEQLLGVASDATLNPDECVAAGAAILAYERYGSVGQLGEGKPRRALGISRVVRDVTGHSLGMIAVNADGDRYINSILLPKSQPIPCCETRPYQTKLLGSAEERVIVYVTQGESEEPGNCSFVGRYAISGFTGKRGGTAVLDVMYSYDQSDIVEVSAKEQGSGNALIVDKEELPDDMNWVLLPPVETPEVGPTSVCIAVDLSGSMSGSPLKQAQAAIESFVRSTDLTHIGIAVISFADSTRLDHSLTHDARLVQRAVRNWKIGKVGYGTTTDPFDEIHKILVGLDGRKCAVILTDGVWANQDRASKRSMKCRDSGIEVIAIGFGEADERFLKRVSTTDDLAVLTELADLPATFERVAQVITSSTGAISRLK